MVAIYTSGVFYALGAALALIFAYSRRDRRLIMAPIAAVLVLSNVGVSLLAYPIAHDQTKIVAVGGFHQSLDGSLSKYKVDVIPCEQSRYFGSNCEHTFPCDDYQVQHDSPTTDKNGNVTHHYWYTTEYESCPIATNEYTYKLLDNFGNEYVVASHIFAAVPRQRRSDRDGDTHTIPGDVPRGVPARWQKAKDDILAGYAPSVATDNTYDNIIIGGSASAFIVHSDDVVPLRAHGLLPKNSAGYGFTDGIHDDYVADKIAFLGMAPPANRGVWIDDLMRMNAPLGMILHGDMHVLAVRDSELRKLGVTPDRYIRAFKSDTQTRFDKYALPKNAILLAIGVDDSGTQVLWARGETGMPIGNHEMTDLLQYRLTQGTPFDPDILIGKAPARIVDGKPVYTDDSGKFVARGMIPQVVMVDIPFARACMKCTDANEKGQHSFVNLMDLIPVSGWAVFWTLLITLVIAIAITAAALWLYGWLTDASIRTSFASEPDFDQREKEYLQ